jgi:hypothetical protein
MKKLLIIAIPLAILAACGVEVTDKPEIIDETVLESTVCNCLDTLANVDRIVCDSLFPEPFNNEEKTIRMEEALACGMEIIYTLDTIASLDSLPEPKSIEDVLTMDVPDPLSEECQQFLEDFAGSIKKCTRIINKSADSPDNVMLMIETNDAKDELREWASKPQMFRCDDNKSFAHLVKKLIEQQDKLLSN